jgi:hypothetical protein
MAMNGPSGLNGGSHSIPWYVEGLFFDERTAWGAAAELAASGFDAGEIRIVNRENLSSVVPTEVWPHFERKLSGGMVILFAGVALLGFLRSAVIALAFAGATALGAIVGQRAALVEHRRLRATLAAGGALLFVSVYEVDREDCAREILSRYCALEINVQDFT